MDRLGTFMMVIPQIYPLFPQVLHNCSGFIHRRHEFLNKLSTGFPQRTVKKSLNRNIFFGNVHGNQFLNIEKKSPYGTIGAWKK